MTMHFQNPERSMSLMRRIRRALHERTVRIHGTLVCLGLTCIAIHRMLFRRDEWDDLSNLERWLVRNMASQFCNFITVMPLNDALTSHLPYRSAGGWRCLLCPSWTERPLRGRCFAPLMVSATDVWRHLRQERCRLRTRCGG